jgi:hypothetical protein
LDFQDIRYKLRHLFEGFDQNRLRRAKLIGAGVLLTLAVLWVGVRVAPLFKSPRRAQELTGPGWTLVGELNDALLKKQEFADTQFSVESEDPLKLRLVGAVRSERELAELKDYVRTLNSDVTPEQIEYEVEILK